MHKLKKTVLVLISTSIIIIAVVLIFISTITKYVIEKYDDRYTGRQITIGWVYVNPFTGYIHFNNLNLYELKSNTVFFSVKGLSVNLSLLKMLSKTYEISELTLDNPKCIIIQNKDYFNFNDLIEKFSSKEDSNSTKDPVYFNILDVEIHDGIFYYYEMLIPIRYSIKEVNFESKGKRWDTDTVSAKFSFLPGIGSGDVKGDFTINLDKLDYRFAVLVNNLDLNIIEQYLKDLTNYGTFSAKLDADMEVRGNFNDEENVTSSGLVEINDFHFGKNTKDDYASFDKLVIAINEVSPMNHVYLFDSISVTHPYFKYERYDYLDNMETMFGKDGGNITAANSDADKFNLVIEIANYIKRMSHNFFESDYKINRLAIYNGDIKFNDYSLSEKFYMELGPLYIIADSIDKNHKRVNLSFRSGIKPYGNISIALSINPKDSSDFDLEYHFKKLPIAMFNPYVISYTSFPLDRGTIELNGIWNVRNGIIKSNNHLVIIDPRTTMRLRNKDIKWVPVPLIMSFIRERGNVIDYEIPITGNLKNPKFNLKDVIFDVLKNIFIKPATIPYIMKIRNIETEIEKSLTLKWQIRDHSLIPKQEKFIERMADFLVENTDATIDVYPQQYAIKEKEYILFFEAKKKYFMMANNITVQYFSEADSEKVNKMSVKDTLFVNYLEKLMKTSTIFTIQDKCALIIDSMSINANFDQLNIERENAFMFYFKSKGVENQVRILKGENVIPYNGFSFYRIQYKGEFPEPLKLAYEQMTELNDEAPRNKFEKERRKNKGSL